MTGFGIREQFSLIKSLGNDLHWREDSFLQQLSMNGSMLWMPNHDSYWLLLCDEAMRKPNTGWTTLREFLVEQPSGQVRRVLWHTSYQYFRQLKTAYLLFLEASLQSGERPPEVKALEERLERIQAQLKKLQWCAEDKSAGKIEIVQALPAPQRD